MSLVVASVVDAELVSLSLLGSKAPTFLLKLTLTTAVLLPRRQATQYLNSMLHNTFSELPKLWKPGRRQAGQYGGINPRSSNSPTVASDISWSLPQELLDYTIDFLHDDAEALASCSLVSRQWNSSAKHHLFSFIHLSGREKLLAFLELIRSPNSICAHIRGLQVNGQYSKLRPVVTVDLLSTIFNSLPFLAHLTLVHVHLTRIEYPNNRAALPAINPQFKLKQLTFAYGGGVPHQPQQSLDIVRMFSEINNLSMLYPRFEHTMMIVPDIAGQFDASFVDVIPKELRVKKIVIEDTTFGTKFWLEALRRSASVQTLSSINILTSFSWDPEPAGLLLAAVGSNVRSLKLDVTGILSQPNASGSWICERLCLSSCTGLRHFSLRTRSDVGFSDESWERICNMVAAVAAHGTLETFTISGYFGSLLMEIQDMSEWAPLRQALSASKALRQVTFVDEIWRWTSSRVVDKSEMRLREYHLVLPEDVEVCIQADEPQEE
ncbi:hypothetical protein BC835DRAFT_1518376 [Cytidiella melzeri]|nr:hypothetical protein BC835DRAFT_1518376 [Cytidiella melzeri]